MGLGLIIQRRSHVPPGGVAGMRRYTQTVELGYIKRAILLTFLSISLYNIAD